MKTTLLFALAAWAISAAAAEDPQSLEALRLAAARGDIEAQVELGILYEYGFRHPDNLVPALAWYLRAAEAGQNEAAKRRDALMAKLKPEEVEQAKRLAPTLAAAPVNPAAAPGAPSATTAGPAPGSTSDKPLF